MCFLYMNFYNYFIHVVQLMFCGQKKTGIVEVSIIYNYVIVINYPNILGQCSS